MSLWALTWPMFIELVLAFTLGLEDSFYLARISDQAAGAVGALLPVFGICNMVFQSFAQSGASVASQYLGGGHAERARRTFLTMLGLNGLLGIAAAALLLVGHRQVGLWMGLSAETYTHATDFLGLVGPMLFIQGLRFAYAAILNARGETRFNMLAALFVNFANISLNHLLTMGSFGLPRLGVKGVAWSTIVAQLLGLLVAAAAVHLRLRIRWNRDLKLADLRPCVAPILRIALPSVVEPVSFQLQQLVLVRIVVSLGDVALVTRTYTLNLIVFSIVWSFTLALGTQIKIAHYVGARRFDEAQAQLLRSLKLGMALGSAVMVLLALAARPLYGIFTKDPAVLDLGQKLLLLGLLLEPCRTSNMVVGGSLRGSGDARFPSFVSVVLTWGIAIPLAWVFTARLGLGLVGVWMAMIADEGSRGLMNYLRWQTGIWRHKGVLETERAGSGAAAH
jgi:putative MATE family efflux protein